MQISGEGAMVEALYSSRRTRAVEEGGFAFY